MGAAVAATDLDGHTLTYSLSGTDAGVFEIDAASGQLSTKVGVTYDYEAKSSYEVMLTVDDGNSGTDSITVAITLTDVNEPPLAPAQPMFGPPTANSLEVIWSAPDNAARPAITGYDLRYKLSTVTSWTDGPQNVAVDTLSAEIGSLTSGAQYDVQARASNADGDGPWSASGAGSTSPAQATASGVTVYAFNLPSGNALAAAPLADGHASRTPPADKALETGPVDVSLSHALSGGQQVTLCMPGTGELARHDGAQWNVLTGQSTRTIEGSAAACATVTEFSPFAVLTDGLGQVTGLNVTPAPNALDLSWTAVTDATGYKVQWKSGVEDYDSATREAAVTGTTHTIPNLTPGTQYTVRVAATKSGEEDGAWSDEMTGTPTDAGICGRTQQVQDALVAAISEVSDCANVTDTYLAGISGALDLHDQSIASLQAGDFAGLTSLTILDLHDNQLSTLPANAFSGLTTLTTLYLKSNQLSTLPAAISGLTTLTILDLDSNRLSTLPTNAFSGLTSLTQLYLNFNELSTLPANAFGGLTSLTYLRLDGNQLSTLPANAFSGLTLLTQLWLDGNQLSTLPANAFSGLTSLTYLRLDGNTVNPLPLTVSLELAGDGQFKAAAPSGAPFAIVVPVTVANGSIDGGATTLTIPAGAVESSAVTVTRTGAASDAVTADIGILPGLPSVNHRGYFLEKAASLPLEVIPGVGSLGRVTIAVGAGPVTEGTSTEFTITVDPAPASPLRVNLTIADRPGASGLAVRRETVTIPATQASVTHMVATTNDNVQRPDGVLRVTVMTGKGYAVGTPRAAVVWVTDDDDPAKPTVFIRAVYPEPDAQTLAILVPPKVAEGSPAQFIVGAYPPQETALTVHLSIVVTGSYVATSPSQTGRQSVVIPAGGSTTTHEVTTEDDETMEDYGSITATLQVSADNYTVGPADTATVIIADNDAPAGMPVISIKGPTHTVFEDEVAVFTITANPAPASDLTVHLNNSIPAAYFISSASATAVIPTSGEVEHSISFRDDTTAELYGSVTVTVSPGTGYVVGTPKMATAVVGDNDKTAKACSDEEDCEPPSTIDVGLPDEVVEKFGPTADAGPDLSGAPGESVALHGTVSTNSNGEWHQMAHGWTQLSGPPVTLSDVARGNPTFTLPDDAQDGAILEFELTVTDQEGESDSDTMTVTVVGPVRPTAKAGPDLIGVPGESVTLQGRGSTNPYGKWWHMDHLWTQLSGPTVALSDRTIADPTFTVPADAEDGTTLEFELTVTDQEGQSDSDTVTVTVGAPETVRPTAKAGPDLTGAPGRGVTLQGRGSTNPYGAWWRMTHAWTQLAGPTVTLSDPARGDPSFTIPADAAGGTTLEFQLTVTDQEGQSDSDTMVVTVTGAEPANTPPTAAIDAAQVTAAVAGETVALQGVGSDAETATESLTFAWSQVGGTPPVSIASASTATAGFTAPDVTEQTELTFRLTVTDEGGLSASAETTIAISPPPEPENTPPTAAIDAAQVTTAEAGETVALQGVGNDAETAAESLTFAWSQVGGMPTVSIISASTATASFTAQGVTEETELTFRLTVTDAGGLSASAETTIAVSPPPEPENTPPTAAIDAAQVTAAEAGETVALQGVGGDAETAAESLTFAWSQVGGTPSVSIISASTATASFTAPDVAEQTELTFRLTVTDEGGLSASAETTIAISPPPEPENTPPTAAIDAAQVTTAEAGETVQLQGVGGDAETAAGSLTFAWSQAAGTPTVSIVSASPATASFTAPDVTAQTELTFRLTVTDAGGLSASAETTIAINPPPEPEPTLVTSCFTDLGSLTGAAEFSGAWDDADCRAHHRDSAARYIHFTLSEETEVSITLRSESGGALFVSKDTPQNGWGTPPGATYEHRVNVRRDNGKLVHDGSNRVTLTLAPGATYTVEAVSTAGGGNFTLSITPSEG